jgi:arylsulfatase
VPEAEKRIYPNIQILNRVMKHRIKSVCRGALISGGSLLCLGHGTEISPDKTGMITQNRTSPPNIILIMTDQHNAGYLHCLGRTYLKTPNLDALAQQSAIFTSAYTASPVCGPSRAAIFTGQYAVRNGVYSNWIPLKNKSLLLTEHLSEAGYHNVMIGKLHLTPVDSSHGFHCRRICDSPYDVYDKREVQVNDYLQWAAKSAGINREKLVEMAGESERLGADDPRFWLGNSWADDKHQMTTWTGNEAVSFIKGYDGKQPFFMHISFFGPHHPYSTCEPWNSMYKPEEVVLPPTLKKDKPGSQKGNHFDWPENIWREIIAKYSGSISAIDLQIGRIVAELKEKGLWDNTLIVFTSDHGDSMGDFSRLGKGTMLESSVKVPFLIKPPGNNLSGEKFPEVINLIDLYATFLDYAGVPESSPADSRSLRQLLNGDSVWNNRTFSSLCSEDCRNGQVMLISDKFKCVVNLKDGAMSAELYDRAEQVADLHNIADNPEYYEIKEKMKSTIEEWLKTELIR